VHGQIYKNGVAIGIDHNLTSEAGTTHSEDFEDFVAGDKIQIYAYKGLTDDYSAIIENMRIYYDLAIVPLVVAIQDPNPGVTTQDATNVLPQTATLNGTVTALGFPAATQHGFCWGTSENPTTTDPGPNGEWGKTEKGAPEAIGAFTSDITGLTYSLTYYVRAYITNSSGTVYGNQVSFVAEA
ncbi:unnamed protein product, partial [marine sediment metagenome]